MIAIIRDTCSYVPRFLFIELAIMNFKPYYKLNLTATQVNIRDNVLYFVLYYLAYHHIMPFYYLHRRISSLTLSLHDGARKKVEGDGAYL